MVLQVVELLIRKLESEPSFHRKVDLFFLVDSITQCSHNQKGCFLLLNKDSINLALSTLVYIRGSNNVIHSVSTIMTVAVVMFLIFFLHSGIAGALYVPTVQAALPRLVGAAAPPGASARENRRQCLKVIFLFMSP
jgi:hypothetical protein